QGGRMAVAVLPTERLLVGDLPVGEDEEAAVADLPLAELDAGVALDDLESGARRGEEELMLALADPEGAADAAGGEDRAGHARVEPRGGHRAREVLEGVRVVVRVGGEGEDRLRVDRHPRLAAGAA